MWLGSALALPLPAAISDTLVTPARALCERVMSRRDRRAPVRAKSAGSVASVPEIEGGVKRKDVAQLSAIKVRNQAPRRARPPADFFLGF